MSEWPKRYECLDLDEDLDYNTPDRWIQCVSLEDFERLLTFTVRMIEAQHSQPLILGGFRESILAQLKKEAENDR
jgi:hypothetical protein